MIFRSFEFKKIEVKKYNFYLFYGENEGLKKELIDNNFKKTFQNSIYSYEENLILQNQKNFFDEILTRSFFETEKLIIISEASNKIINIIEELIEKKIQDIYKKYCNHKKFKSVQPLFANDIKVHKVMVYYDDGKFVAFSLLYELDKHNVEALQFAWDYGNPKLRLGVVSLENECHWAKANGYKYLYLGQDDRYKSQFKGWVGSISTNAPERGKSGRAPGSTTHAKNIMNPKP